MGEHYRNPQDSNAGVRLVSSQDCVRQGPEGHIAIHHSVHEEWRITAEVRERALAKRHHLNIEKLNEHVKELEPLNVSQSVLERNQAGVVMVHLIVLSTLGTDCHIP